MAVNLIALKVHEHHLIVTHEATNTGSDRSQLAKAASQAKDILGADHLDAVEDRGYFNKLIGLFSASGIMASGGAGKLHRDAGGDHAVELQVGLVNPDDAVILVVDPNDRVGVDIFGLANEFAQDKFPPFL
jgi:hypothetical protein